MVESKSKQMFVELLSLRGHVHEFINEVELPVIGSLRPRTDFWDRHGANMVTRWKKT